MRAMTPADGDPRESTIIYTSHLIVIAGCLAPVAQPQLCASCSYQCYRKSTTPGDTGPDDKEINLEHEELYYRSAVLCAQNPKSTH